MTEQTQLISRLVEDAIQHLQDAHRALSSTQRFLYQDDDKNGETIALKAQVHIRGDLHALVDYIKTLPQKYWSKDWTNPDNLPNLSIP